MDSTNPSRRVESANEERVIAENQVRNALTTSIANIRFLEIKQELLLIAAYIAPPEPIPMPTSFLDIRQEEMSNFPRLVDIQVLNSRNLLQATLTRTSRFLLTPTLEVRQALQSADYAFVDTTLDGVENLFVTARLVAKFVRMIPKTPATYIDNTADAIQYVDLTKLPGRDLYKIAEGISNDLERHNFIMSLKRRYHETGVRDLPVGVVPYDSARAHYGESVENFTAYTVPYLRNEVALVEIARGLFHQTYVHPSVVVKAAERFANAYSVVSGETKAAAIQASSNVKVLENVYARMDVATMYSIPSAITELAKEIDQMIRVNIALNNVGEVQKQFSQILRSSVVTTTAKQEYPAYLDPNHAAQMVVASHKALINPNIFYVHLQESLLGWVFDDVYEAIGVFVMQLIFPPNVIDSVQRLRINNLLAYQIVQLLLGPDNFKTLEQQAEAVHMVFPGFSNGHAWAQSQEDELQKMYHVGSTLFNTPKYVNVKQIFKYYFNGLDPLTNGRMIKMPDGSIESASISTPYLLGAVPTKYARDVSFDRFRTTRNMYPNGALLITEETRVNHEPNPIRIINKLEIIRLLFGAGVGKRSPTGYRETAYTSGDVNKILSHIQLNGVQAIQMIQKYYVYSMHSYSTSIAADGILRNVSLDKKKPLYIRPKFGLTLFLLVRTGLYLNDPVVPYLYSGIKIASELQLFIALYRYVQSRIPMKSTVVLKKIQLLAITTKLMSILTGVSDYDPKKAFGYADADPATWDRFLSDDEILKDKNPLFKTFEAVLQVVGTMLEDPFLNRKVYKKFYLVRTAIMGGGGFHGGTVIAASTVRSVEDLNIIARINNMAEYQALLNDVQVKNNEYGNEFDRKWLSPEMSRQDREARLSGAITDKIGAIEVNMQAVVDLTIIKEDGSFTVRHGGPSMSKDQFVNHLGDAKTGDISKAKMFRIPITVILNDVGSGPHVGPWPMMKMKDSILGTLPETNVIIPFKEIPLNIMHGNDLINEFCNKVTVRKEPYEVKDKFTVNFERKL